MKFFGSAARESFDSPRSNLDFLAPFEDLAAGPYAAEACFRLLENLEGLLRRPVYLVANPAFRTPCFQQTPNTSRPLVYVD